MRVWLFIYFIVGVWSSSRAQETRDTLSVSFSQLPLEIVLDSISYKTGYFFSYNADALPKGSLYSLSRKHIYINELLDILLVGSKLEYSTHGDQVILHSKEKKQQKGTSFVQKVQVTGWVREYTSKKPIVGASVFINGTTMGAVTDLYGNYKLKEIPHGTYTLVFSHVGYELASYSISLVNNTTYAINALLDFRVLELSDVEVISNAIVSGDDRDKYYRKFVKEFFGTSANAGKCEILNPEAVLISFDTDLSLLRAEGEEPLVIENKALGYRITYDLEYFSKTNHATNFYGKALFEVFNPENPRIRKKVVKNRLKSYKGSIFHFTKCLIRNDLAAEGYKMFLLDDLAEVGKGELEQVRVDEILKSGDQRHEWKLDFNGYLLVIYENELESSQYLSTVNNSQPFNGVLSEKPRAQKSVLELTRTYVTLDRNGQIKEPMGATTIGYWSWERIAELMPADYDPKVDNL